MRYSAKLQYGLATILAAVTILSIWLATASNRARDQNAGVASVQSSGGVVQFETTLEVPEWLRTAIGEEYFRNEKTVSFAENGGRQPGTKKPKATDTALRHLVSLDSIETLELGNNKELTDSSLVHLKPLRELTTVYLYRTGVRGPGLLHLVSLPKITTISLSDTPLGDSGVAYLGQMSHLSWARLDNTKVTDASMAELAKANSLKMLTLSNTAITDAGLMHLAQLQNLETLDVCRSGVTADGVARLRKALPNCNVVASFGLGEAPNDERLFQDRRTRYPSEINLKLKELKIDGEVQTDSTNPDSPIVSLRLFDTTRSSDVVLDLMRYMPDIKDLNLRRTLVDDEFVKAVTEFKNIRRLSLQASRVTDDGLQHLFLLPNLHEVSLVETAVTDAGLQHLQRQKGLRSIELNSTRVTSDGIEWLKQTLPNCNVNW